MKCIGQCAKVCSLPLSNGELLRKEKHMDILHMEYNLFKTV